MFRLSLEEREAVLGVTVSSYNQQHILPIKVDNNRVTSIID